MQFHQDIITKLLFIIGVSLLLLNLYGIIHPMNMRNEFQEEIMNNDIAIQMLDEKYKQLGSSDDFVIYANDIISQAMKYTWPKDLKRIPIKENWILYTLGWIAELEGSYELDQLLHYERGLARGFGICSQIAYVLSDILYKRYNIDAILYDYKSHVIVTFNGIILDPSAGVTFMQSALSQNDCNDVIAIYDERGYRPLAKTLCYNDHKVYGRHDKIKHVYRIRYILEDISYILKWIIPILLCFITIVLHYRYHSNKDDNPT